MTNLYRAMCAELVELSAPVDSVPQLTERLQQLDRLANRARALLAQPELVAHQDKLDRLIALDRAHPEPKGEDCPGCEGTPVASNSPCAVCGRAQPEPVAEEPTDEELLRVAASAIAPYKDCGIAVGQYEPEAEPAIQVYGSELIAYARAALARWGRPTPQPVPYTERLQAVEALAADAVSGLRYIEQTHGRLYGVGWDRVFDAAAKFLPANALPTPEATNDY